MPNPRSGVSFEGIDYEGVTAIADGVTITYDATKNGGSAAVGKAVKISASATVALTTDASQVAGKLIHVDPDGKCTVQFEGFMGLPGGTAATLTPGSKVVGALNGGNPGYIRSVAAATLAEVAVARGCIWDASDATNTYVDL